MSYIDLDELVKRINDNIKPETPDEKALIEWCKDECIRQAHAMPKADVAPISEVEKWYHEFHRVKDELRQEREYYRATEKAADKYFAELQAAKTKGEWREDNFTKILKCNICGNDAPISTTSGEQYKAEYCQSCGAKMCTEN